MEKNLSLIALLLCVFFTSAQYKVQFVFKKLPSYQLNKDTVFIAGNINNWNPADKRFAISPSQLKSGITIDFPRGMLEYKFTRGSWEEAESGSDGFPTENRRLAVEADTTLFIEIDHWADHFPKKPKESTASKNVHIIDTAFYIPQLNRHRRVWIYLPDTYTSSKKIYPVLYMHDGQNLFDNQTAAYGEWGIDEALDTLGKEHGESIVVGIDNGMEKRMNEYAPFDMEKHGKGEGDAYVDFLVHTLMPYINKHYRTKKGARFTAVAGSSMGGLISFYAALKYPKVFGTAGVFSPAFWIVPQLKEYATKQAKKVKGNLYLYAGAQEGESMVPDMLQVLDIMSKHDKIKIESVVRAEGRHNEQTWRQEFPLFYKWMMRRATMTTDH